MADTSVSGRARQRTRAFFRGMEGQTIVDDDHEIAKLLDRFPAMRHYWGHSRFASLELAAMALRRNGKGELTYRDELVVKLAHWSGTFTNEKVHAREVIDLLDEIADLESRLRKHEGGVH